MCEREKQSAFWDIDAQCVRRYPRGDAVPQERAVPAAISCPAPDGFTALPWCGQQRTEKAHGAELLRELLLHMLTFCHTVYRGELMFVAALHDLVHWDKRVEQAAVFLDTSPCGDAGALCDDETAFLQQTNML